MTSPSWRHLAAIPESLLKRRILQALAIEPPPEGISRELDLGDNLRFQHGDGGLIVTSAPGGSRYIDPKEALRTFKLSKGLPSGDLARWWLQAHGYFPLSL